MTPPVSLIGVSDGLPPSGYRRQELHRKAWVSLKERATGNPSNVAGRKPEAKHWKTQEENTSLSGALCSAGKKHHLNNKTDNKGVILCEGFAMLQSIVTRSTKARKSLVDVEVSVHIPDELSFSHLKDPFSSRNTGRERVP